VAGVLVASVVAVGGPQPGGAAGSEVPGSVAASPDAERGVRPAPTTGADGPTRRTVTTSPPAWTRPPVHAPRSTTGPDGTLRPEVVPRVATAPTDEGYDLVLGGSHAGSGPTVTFTVEVEPATGIDPGEALRTTEDALYDRRSWGNDWHLIRVDEVADADIRVVFATPHTVDELCGQVGLQTNGIYSCWNERIAAINAWRYAFGATGFDSIRTYRRYLINHEVGHGLGHGHVGCPAPSALAPVMMQQTAALDGCRANGWPYPDA
jgi:hypothetical protein